MPPIDRATRRQRILNDKNDRLALITGRAPSSPPQSLSLGAATAKFAAQSPLLLPRNRNPPSCLSRRPQDTFTDKNVSFPAQGREGTILPRHKSSSEAWSISSLDQLITTPLNLLGSITPKQLNYALTVTEQPRMAFSITMAFLVLMSHFGFMFFGNKSISSIILFKPLLFLLLSNATLILLALLPDMTRVESISNKVAIFDGYCWVEEVGRAIEVVFMLHDVLKTLFLDFIVYSLIIICGFCMSC